MENFVGHHASSVHQQRSGAISFHGTKDEAGDTDEILPDVSSPRAFNFHVDLTGRALTARISLSYSLHVPRGFYRAAPSIFFETFCVNSSVSCFPYNQVEMVAWQL
ncbi:hypothetical protein E2562_004963 [Oryza meyeriana var. granulata]|uniref:Uncharacterized protein n=1 Tax=Oryza meyeriana var. granulata TaxID=110450 RepID=A0A6G1C587_9ORYZ|nr:hypothetical protein E2562_004963 [Oryza meyeriana var. granulata]